MDTEETVQTINRQFNQEKRSISNDETSQTPTPTGSLNNLTQFVELSKKEGNTLPSTFDKRLVIVILARYQSFCFV